MKITLLRHSKTDSSEPEGSKRLLTQEGIEIAKRCRVKMFHNPRFDLVVNSEHPRTRQTALIVAGVNETSSTEVLKELWAYENEPWRKPIEAAFARHAVAPFIRYIEDREVWGDLFAYANNANYALRKLLDKNKSKLSETSHILVVGHAIFLPAMAYAICPLEADRKKIAGATTHECDGFRLELDHDYYAKLTMVI